MNSVVITGVGAYTPFAPDASALWDYVARPSRPVRKNELNAPFEQVERTKMSGEKAVQEALTDAGLWDGAQLAGLDRARIGSTLSVSKPLLGSEGEVIRPDVISDHLSERFGIEGERRNVIAACATGAYATALGAMWIEEGLCDIVLAGSVEPPTHPLIEAGFKRMGVISSEPNMRPFDRHRSGFVLSHGAAVVVLESRAHAQQRGARIQAILSGWGWGSDTHSPVAFNSNGELIAQVIRKAFKRAGLTPESIHHVNAHGTATVSNDWIETQALMKAFGTHADRLMISGTKSSTGHLLGAAGSIELVLTILALRNQFVPPTAHLNEPEAALDYTPQQGHAASFDHALSLSFGFGGPIGALVVSQAS